MEKEPLLSVSVVTYQHKNYIKECLDGVLMQKTNFPFEIIIGEDESTDGTREICIAYANKYPEKIRLFLRSRKDVININNKPSGRFNFIENIKAARGKYIAICEGDDYWTDENKLQKQVDFLEANKNFSVCFHNVLKRNEKVNPIKESVFHKTLETTIFETEDILKQWFIPTASIVFRKYDDFIFPEWFSAVQSGDIALLLLLSLKGELKYLNEVMAVYRLHGKGISTTHTNYIKVIGMTYLYQAFNIYTNYKFNDKLQEAIISEFRTHIPELHVKPEQQNKLKRLIGKIIAKLKSK